MREIDKIAENLFEKIRSRFDGVNLGDENAKATSDPEKARFFNFDFVINGTAVGNVTVSLIDEDSLKVYFGQDIADNIKENGLDKEVWFDFLKSLRKFAKRNMLSFDTRDVARANLRLKDIKQQAKADATVTSDEVQVTESRLYGTSRHSFADIGECKLRIIHSTGIDEEKHGSRARNIEAIFIETPHGERFRCGHNNVGAAAALAQHITHGGTMHDEIAECINGMVEEMSAMKHFVRSVKRRSDLVDDETRNMANAAVDRYDSLKRQLRHMRGPNGYRAHFENWMPDTPVEEEYDVDALRERFVRKMYDDRFDAALPYVWRAHHRKTESMNNPMAEEFESWADSVLEGTWAVPKEEDQIDKLREIMSKPFAVGNEGQDATSLLYDLIGDDQLFDDIQELADIKGPEYDCRPEIVKWLKHHFPALGKEIEGIVQQSQQPETPAPGAEPVLGQPQPAEQQAAGQAPAPQQPQPTAESTDPLDFIRQLAGLRK